MFRGGDVQPPDSLTEIDFLRAIHGTVVDGEWAKTPPRDQPLWLYRWFMNYPYLPPGAMMYEAVERDWPIAVKYLLDHLVYPFYHTPHGVSVVDRATQLNRTTIIALFVPYTSRYHNEWAATDAIQRNDPDAFWGVLKRERGMIRDYGGIFAHAVLSPRAVFIIALVEHLGDDRMVALLAEFTDTICYRRSRLICSHLPIHILPRLVSFFGVARPPPIRDPALESTAR